MRLPSARKKKKLATRTDRTIHSSAIDWAIAVFPAPAAPLSHNIHDVLKGSVVIQLNISSKTAFRVCSWHRGGSTRCEELWNADVATRLFKFSKPPESAKADVNTVKFVALCTYRTFRNMEMIRYIMLDELSTSDEILLPQKPATLLHT